MPHQNTNSRQRNLVGKNRIFQSVVVRPFRQKDRSAAIRRAFMRVDFWVFPAAS
jgi:hypothetical protein